MQSAARALTPLVSGSPTRRPTVTHRARWVAAAALTLFAGTACTATTGMPQPASVLSSAPPVPDTSVSLPPAPRPAGNGTCPYLPTQFVADANGQHVGHVAVSVDKPYPACFFYRPDNGLQLTARVYRGDAATAQALVNQAAPVATSDPANLDGGWQGGSSPTSTGAVYAVAKGPVAVIITTNQKQTIKARRVAQQAISSLHL